MKSGFGFKKSKIISVVTSVFLITSIILIDISLHAPVASASEINHTVGIVDIQGLSDHGRILKSINRGSPYTAVDPTTFGFMGLVIDHDGYDHTPFAEDIADPYLTYPYDVVGDFVPQYSIYFSVDDGSIQMSRTQFQNEGTAWGTNFDVLIDQTAWSVINGDWVVLQWNVNNVKSPAEALSNFCLGLEIPFSKDGAQYGVGGNANDGGDDIDGYDSINNTYWVQDPGSGHTMGVSSIVDTNPLTHYFARDYHADYDSEYKYFFENETWLYNRIHSPNTTATNGIDPGNVTTTVGWNDETIGIGENKTFGMVIAIDLTYDGMMTAIKDAQDFYENLLSGFQITEFSDSDSTTQRVEIYNNGHIASNNVMDDFKISMDDGFSFLGGNWDKSSLAPFNYTVLTLNPGENIGFEGGTMGLYRDLGGGNTVLLDEVSYGQVGLAPDPISGESVARIWDDSQYAYSNVWTRCHFSGPTWGWENDVIFPNLNSNIVLNEILFNPLVSEDGFIELYLKGGNLNLSGYRIVGDIEYIIPTTPVLTTNDRFFYLLQPEDVTFFSELNPGADNIYLYDKAGALIDMVGWSSPHTQGMSMRREPNGTGTRDGFDDLSSIAAGWIFDCEPSIKVLRLDANKNLKGGDPGDTLFFDLTLLNRQLNNDTVSIINTTINGFQVEVLDETGTYKISEIQTPAASTVEFKVKVFLPSPITLNDFDNITIIVQSQNNSQLEDNISLYGGVYNHYHWILGQMPNQTHVYLYAREGANVIFGGTMDNPIVIYVPPDEFVSYNVGDLGYDMVNSDPLNPDIGWYFLEMYSYKNIMVNIDRAVLLKTGPSDYEWRHGDQLHNMPMMELSTIFYLPMPGSGAGDDQIVMFANEPTNVSVRMLANSGSVWTKDVTIDGLYVTGYLSDWITDTLGYSLMITADKPIAAASFDELSRWPDVWGSGYFFNGAVYTEIFDEYIHVHKDYTTEYHRRYTPTANTFEFYDLNGQLVYTEAHLQEASRIDYYDDMGYSDSPDPFLAHIKTTSPYADGAKSPANWFVNNISAFMGWNASMGILDIYTDSDTNISIYNGRNYNLVAEFPMAANTIFQDTLENLSFDSNLPFLVVVVSEVPAYKAVKVPYFVRPYPAEFAPPVLTPSPLKLYITTSSDKKDAVLYWDPPSAPGIDHYLIYRSTSQTEFDFDTVWKNTSVDMEIGEIIPIPLRTMWNDTNATNPDNVTNYQKEYYYTIRAVISLGQKSATSRTVGKWTKEFPQGVSSFSLPLEPFWTMTANDFLQDMSATYIKWMEPGNHVWMKHGDGSVNDGFMRLGEGYEINFPTQTYYTFCGMPGAMISYDDDSGFLGFDYESDAKNLSVLIDGLGYVHLSWETPSNMGAGDWYEVYYSHNRDGFFGILGVDYFYACPNVNFGSILATHIGAKADVPGARLYYMVVPFNADDVRGAGTYSIGIWTEEYLAQYDTMGIPLKTGQDQGVDWYCDKIPDTVGINFIHPNNGMWFWHSKTMPRGAFDTMVEMTEGYQISTSAATKYTFIGI
jgi:hypothetical protein